MGSKKSAPAAPPEEPIAPKPEVDTKQGATAAQMNARRSESRAAEVAASKSKKNDGVGGASALGAVKSAGLNIG